jgi:hypothetical protein
MPALGYYSASKHALEGLTEALSQEVAPLGIKVLSIQPGGFRTGIVERNLRSPKIDAYDPTAHAVMGMLLKDKEGVYAPGDPDRMAELLVNLVKSGDMPQRLSMGADSWGAITAKLDERRAEYEQWKICPTAPISHDGLKAVPGRSRLCSFRNQVLPTGDSSCVYERLALCKSCPKNTEGFILVVLKPNHAARRSRQSRTPVCP